MDFGEFGQSMPEAGKRETDSDVPAHGDHRKPGKGSTADSVEGTANDAAEPSSGVISLRQSQSRPP